MSEHTALFALIDALRGKGVRSYKGPFESGTIELELGPALVPDPPAEKSVDVDLCKCGHHLVIEHTNGLCLNGCEVDVCHPGKS